MQPRVTKRYVKFGYKLMLSYCLFILVPVLLIGYFANAIYVQSIREKTESNITGTLLQMRDNISYKIAGIERITDLMYFDTTMIKQLKQNQEGYERHETTVKYLMPKFQTIIGAASSKVWMTVYLHSRSIPEFYNNYQEEDPLQVGNRIYEMYHISRIQGKAWYMQFPEEKYGQTTLWAQVEDDNRYKRISLLRRLVDIQLPLELTELGFVRVSLYLNNIFESVDATKIGKGTTIFVTDPYHRVMHSSGAAGLEYGSRLDAAAMSDYLVMREQIPEFGWTLTAIVPNAALEEDSATVRTFTFLICLVLVAVFFIAGGLISSYFSKRVNKIITVADSFQQGEFHKRVHFKGNDEFTRIGQALNELGTEIGDLIGKVYIKDIEKKEAELEMLQAQINPHFLYNTLSSINQLAKFGKTAELQQMVMDLAKFYRLSLSDGRTVIPLGDELEQAKTYVAIQKIKFQDFVQVYFQIEPEIEKYQTVKLILQPFIENVLEHAWTGDRINIRIAGRVADGNIVLQVIDDGVGMAPDVIRRMFDPLERNNVGYGIRNVDNRIKLYFGDEYGIRIFSRPGIGTNVTIAFPARR